MEENNNKVSVKINKIWWILGILVVIVIVANVYVITTNKTQTTTDKNFETEKQANAVRQVVVNTQNDVSEKKIDSESNNTKIDETKVKKAFQDYLNLIGDQEGAPRGMLIELGVIKDYDNETSAKKDGFIKTDVKYSDFKEKMLNYVTEKCYENDFSEFYIEEDGYLCYANVGATGVEYNVINVITDQEEKNAFRGVTVWKQEETEENIDFDFMIDYNNDGKIVIDYAIEHEEKGIK